MKTDGRASKLQQLVPVVNVPNRNDGTVPPVPIDKYLREIANLLTRLLALLTFAACLLSIFANAQTPPPPNMSDAGARAAESAIRNMLMEQVQAWNRGDLNGFMNGYWNSPRLTFYSNGTETEGWQSTLDRYKQRYQGKSKAMGKLDFRQLNITVLCANAAFVRGQWSLAMSDGKNPHGVFTLVLRNIGDRWQIVHDHTSGQ